MHVYWSWIATILKIILLTHYKNFFYCRAQWEIKVVIYFVQIHIGRVNHCLSLHTPSENKKKLSKSRYWLNYDFLLKSGFPVDFDPDCITISHRMVAVYRNEPLEKSWIQANMNLEHLEYLVWLWDNLEFKRNDMTFTTVP